MIKESNCGVVLRHVQGLRKEKIEKNLKISLTAKYNSSTTHLKHPDWVEQLTVLEDLSIITSAKAKKGPDFAEMSTLFICCPYWKHCYVRLLASSETRIPCGYLRKGSHNKNTQILMAWQNEHITLGSNKASLLVDFFARLGTVPV